MSADAKQYEETPVETDVMPEVSTELSIESSLARLNLSCSHYFGVEFKYKSKLGLTSTIDTCFIIGTHSRDDFFIKTCFGGAIKGVSRKELLEFCDTCEIIDIRMISNQ